MSPAGVNINGVWHSLLGRVETKAVHSLNVMVLQPGSEGTILGTGMIDDYWAVETQLSNVQLRQRTCTSKASKALNKVFLEKDTAMATLPSPIGSSSSPPNLVMSFCNKSSMPFCTWPVQNALPTSNLWTFWWRSKSTNSQFMQHKWAQTVRTSGNGHASGAVESRFRRSCCVSFLAWWALRPHHQSEIFGQCNITL